MKTITLAGSKEGTPEGCLPTTKSLQVILITARTNYKEKKGNIITIPPPQKKNNQQIQEERKLSLHTESALKKKNQF